MGGWSLAPVVPATTQYVGRVGALAVALGVGGVLLGWPAAALADEDGADPTGSAPSSATAPAGPTDAAPARRV